jgi:hypothetical protein
MSNARVKIPSIGGYLSLVAVAAISACGGGQSNVEGGVSPLASKSGFAELDPRAVATHGAEIIKVAAAPPAPASGPVMHGGIGVNPASFPAPYMGRGEDLLIPTAEVAPPTGEPIGAFRTVCLRSHFSFDDPIVYPGQPGKAHAHVFFGNTGVDANSTTASFATTGNSTCRGGTINRTGYWAPAMVDTKTSSVIDPVELVIYYKTGYHYVPTESIQPMPVGLRMIAGNAAATTRQSGPAYFTCANQGPIQSAIQDVACAPGQLLWMSINFPQCWDGVNLDSPDHKSHMAYPVVGCPATHPVALPEVTMHILYTVPAAGVASWRLASDMYDPTQPGGFSGHGDWMMGWKPEIASAWAKFCVNPALDCHAHLLGDGRQMVEFDGN